MPMVVVLLLLLVAPAVGRAAELPIVDAHLPERWHHVPEHASWSRAWLADLPPDIAERIAWKNGEIVPGEALSNGR